MKKFLVLFALLIGGFALAGCSVEENYLDENSGDFNIDEAITQTSNFDVITMDVNPSVDVVVGEDDEILAVDYRNEEAQIIAGDRDYIGEDYQTFVNEWVELLIDYGYLEEGDEIGTWGSERIAKETINLIEEKVKDRGVSVRVKDNNEALSELLESEHAEMIANLVETTDIGYGHIRMALSMMEGEFSEEELMELLEMDKNELARGYANQMKENATQRRNERGRASNNMGQALKEAIHKNHQEIEELEENGDFDGLTEDEIEELKEEMKKEVMNRVREKFGKGSIGDDETDENENTDEEEGTEDDQTGTETEDGSEGNVDESNDELPDESTGTPDETTGDTNEDEQTNETEDTPSDETTDQTNQ
jgi:hypothetical protein